MEDEQTAAMAKPAGLGRTLVRRRSSALFYFFPVIWMILGGVQDASRTRSRRRRSCFSPRRSSISGRRSIGSRPTASGVRHRARTAISPTASSFRWSASRWRWRWAPSPLTALRGCASSGATISCSTFWCFGWSRRSRRSCRLYFLFRVTGLGGSYIAIIVVYTAFNLPFAIWMLKSFIDELHRPIEEAARLDGSSELEDSVADMPAANARRVRGDRNHRFRLHLERLSVQPVADQRRPRAPFRWR